MSTIFKVHTLYTLAWFMHNSIQLSINMAWAPAWLYMGKHVLPCQIALYDHGCLTLILDNTVQFFIYCVYERLCACKILNAKTFCSHPCKPYPYASVHICAHASDHVCKCIFDYDEDGGLHELSYILQQRLRS